MHARPWLSTFLMTFSLLAAAAPAPAQDMRATPESKGGQGQQSVVTAQKFMVVSANPLASKAGYDVLKEGGSAVDAAIAANACLGLVEPTGSGMGGDLFAQVWNPADKKLYGLNSSGRSPQRQSLDDLTGKLGGRNPIPAYGILPITVPGAVAGWGELHKKFGKLPFAELFEPVIKHAREGFAVTPYIASLWAGNLAVFKRNESLIPFKENLYKAWTVEESRAPKAGEIFRHPELAATYERVAKAGARDFYEGDIAGRIVAFLRKAGAAYIAEDFGGFLPEWVTPISTEYNGVTVHQLPPSGQGATVLEMLNILKHHYLPGKPFGSAEALHTMIETKKLAFIDRSRFLGDVPFRDIPLAEMISDDWAKKRAEQISPKRVLPAGPEAIRTGDTIYLATADKSGMMVSLIQSNYRGMGSGVVPDGLGFIFQNRGQQFNLRENHPNIYAAGKRPFHTIIPGFATRKGEPWLAFGVMGGTMQPQGHVQIITNLVDYGFNLQEAGDAPRWRHLGSPDPGDGVIDDGETGIALEKGIERSEVDKLLELGHKLVSKPQHMGGYQAVMRLADGGYAAATETRADGIAASL